MEEMNCQNKRCKEILAKGKQDGFEFKILSLGTHPCAYVAIPKAHLYHEKDYDNCDIECHGGLTYGRQEDDGKWWLGWDYAHCGDYTSQSNFCRELLGDVGGDKKWTTAEIFDEVKNVISQLKAVAK